MPFVHRLERWGVASFVSSLLLPWLVAGGAKLQWSAPISYQEDALFSLQLIKRMLDGGWFFNTDQQGFPGYSNMLDFPAADLGLYVVEKFLCLVFHDVGVVFNVFFFAGFGASSVAAYWVLRQLQIRPHIAFAGALSFAVAPYHFARLCHLMLSWFFVIPLFVYLTLRVLRLIPCDGRPDGRAQWSWRHYLSAALLACFGIYYAFFGAMLLCFAGAFAFFKGQWGEGRHALGLVATVFLGVVLNVLPTLINNHVNGRNTDVVARFPNETEVYGIKLVQLVMPPASHRIRFMNSRTGHYNDDFPLTNENRMSALGLIGSAGLLLLLFRLLFNQLLHSDDDQLMNGLVFLVAVMVLMGTIGGFSSLFAMYVTPMIRAWNRVSIYIAFVSIAALALHLERRRWTFSDSRMAGAAFAVAMTVFVGIDQTPRDFLKEVRASNQQYLMDREFVGRIEASIPAGSAVLQLPYMYFPEGPTLVRMGCYEHGRPYLHSRTLRWSYGSIRGREADRTVHALSDLPFEAMIAKARKMGFSGIYVDRFGFKDSGKEVESLLRQSATGAILESSDKRRFFVAI